MHVRDVHVPLEADVVRDVTAYNETNTLPTLVLQHPEYGALFRFLCVSHEHCAYVSPFARFVNDADKKHRSGCRSHGVKWILKIKRQLNVNQRWLKNHISRKHQKYPRKVLLIPRSTVDECCHGCLFIDTLEAQTIRYFIKSSMEISDGS